MWCHPELGSQFSLRGILPMVGDVGTLVGNHCSIRRGDQGGQCPCVRVRSNASQIPGAAPDRVALYFADSTSLLQSSNAAVGRVGVPGDGVEARCAGGSAIWGIVSVGKAGQLECRRKLARRAGCSYEGLRLQAPQYVLSSPDECAQWTEATKAGGHGWMLKPTVGSFGRGISYLPPDKAHAEALQRCGTGARTMRRRRRRLLQQKARPRPNQPRRSWLAMRYVPPMLVGGHKVELRSYLLIARTRPLLALTHEGIARHADFAYDAASSKPAAHILNLRYDGGKMLGDDHFWSWRKLGRALSSEHRLGAEHMETIVRAEVDRVSTFEVHAMRGNPAANPERPLTSGAGGGGGSHPLRSFQFFSLDWALGPDGRPSLIEKNVGPGTHPYRSVDGLMPSLITTMLQLVALMQTAPVETLRTMRAGPGATHFAFGGWRLVHNQLHEQPAAPYNACAVRGHMP